MGQIEPIFQYLETPNRLFDEPIERIASELGIDIVNNESPYELDM
jgi:hypothetical protein